MKPSGNAAFTWIEALVCLAVIVILAFLALPAISVGHHRSPMSYALSNMKQLHLATHQMDLDATTTGETNIGWPGDIGGTFSNWTAQILAGNYLTKSDLCKLLSAPGVIVQTNNPLVTNTTALLVYAVRSESPARTVFLTSANFPYTAEGGVSPGRRSKPFGKEGFVVFRKGGDGAIFKPNQAGDTNLIGGFAPLCR